MMDCHVLTEHPSRIDHSLVQERCDRTLACVFSATKGKSSSWWLERSQGGVKGGPAKNPKTQKQGKRHTLLSALDFERERPFSTRKARKLGHAKVSEGSQTASPKPKLRTKHLTGLRVWPCLPYKDITEVSWFASTEQLSAVLQRINSIPDTGATCSRGLGKLVVAPIFLLHWPLCAVVRGFKGLGSVVQAPQTYTIRGNLEGKGDISMVAIHLLSTH